MAIDTADKRAAAMLPLMPWRSKLPLPDSTIDASDRAQTAFMYVLAAGGTPAEEGAGTYYPTIGRRRR